MKTDNEAPDARSPFLQMVPPALSGLVSRIICYESDGVVGAGDREIASFVVPIIICFADPFRIAFDRGAVSADRIGSFVSGLHPGYVDIGYEGPVSCVQINLTPIGARLFFERPMCAFATRLVPLEDVGDRRLNDLRGWLSDARSGAERLRIASSFMEHHLLGRAVKGEISFIWSEIQRSRGDLRIDRLTDQLGWSRKRLVAHARDAFGMTPKRLARVARFQHATRLAQSVPRVDWAGIAATCGYSDQAHLVREFNALAGETPERWSSRQDVLHTKQNDKTGEVAGL